MHLNFDIRTDLALESKELYSDKKENGKIPGVSFNQWDITDKQIHLTKVRVLDENGSLSLHKPIGTYITIESQTLLSHTDDYHFEVSKELGSQLCDLIKGSINNMQESNILIVGLGNLYVTPDSLGPKVVNHLYITRRPDLPSGPYKNGPFISSLVPGVMAQTGMETCEILSGLVKQTHPDLIITIDALAARSIHRLGTTIQITDTGIQPGSGVGNHRHSLTKETLGVPVIAIGIPTVVSAAAIIHDTISVMINTLRRYDEFRPSSNYIETMDSDDQFKLIHELLDPEFKKLYVTPPDIDETINCLSYTISEGIHAACFKH